MYYYKHLNENGEIAQLESRNVEINNISELTVAISEEEYQTLLEKMLKEVEVEPTDKISPIEALEIIVGGSEE